MRYVYRGGLGRVHQEYLGSIRHRTRQSARNSSLWTRNLDTVQKFFRRPQLQITICKKEHNLAWLVKNKDGRDTLQNLRLVIRSPKIVAGGSQMLRGFNLDGGEEIELRFSLDKQKLAILPRIQPEIDRINSSYVSWGWYPIEFNETYDFELKFSASNIRKADGNPKKYKFIPKSPDELELTEIKDC